MGVVDNQVHDAAFLLQLRHHSAISFHSGRIPGAVKVCAQGKHNVDELLNRQRTYANQQGETPLLNRKSAFDNCKRDASELDNDHLQNRGNHQNGAKQAVVQDPREYVDCRSR